MGFYLNPSDKGFWKSVRSEIYVDKTELIACTNKAINTEEQYICVSRPRRFGKSMALKMLAAYYSCGCDSTDLFRGLKIENSETFREHLNQYNVIYLNMQQFMTQAAHGQELEYLEQEVMEELLEEYGDLGYSKKRGLAGAFRKIYTKTQKQFIFLIDEWDCVMRERQESETMQKQYLDFLRDLLKDQPYVALAYMTGILPVKKYGQHSALNMFWEYSMTDPFEYEEYTGFTENEVRGLCERYGMDFAQISNWYDGYQFGLRSDIVQMLGGARIRINTFSFQNDMRNLQTKDDVLTLLVHLGYLGYDAESREAFIPNKEIIGEFENAMSVNGWANVMQILKASDQLLEDTLRGDADRVASALDDAHTQAASILTYNDENSLSCAIGLAYYSARKEYRLIRELPAGKGYADIVFLPLPCVNKPALIVELKYCKTAHAAIQQIKDRQYTQALEDYTGEILMVGINYDKDRKDKPHSCVIERYHK